MTLIDLLRLIPNLFNCSHTSEPEPGHSSKTLVRTVPKSEKTELYHLPDDVITIILSKSADSYSRLCSLRRVCKQWNRCTANLPLFVFRQTVQTLQKELPSDLVLTTNDLEQNGYEMRLDIKGNFTKNAAIRTLTYSCRSRTRNFSTIKNPDIEILCLFSREEALMTPKTSILPLKQVELQLNGERISLLKPAELEALSQAIKRVNALISDRELAKQRLF